MIVGLDGCDDGWMAACQRASGEIGLTVVERPEYLAGATDVRLMVIDIPINRPNGAQPARSRSSRAAAPQTSIVLRVQFADRANCQ